MSNDQEAGSGPSYDAEQDVEQRMRLATPEHTTRGILFLGTLKAIRDLGGDEELVRSCVEACGEKEFVEFFNYPTRALLQVLATAARGLTTRYGSFEEVLRQIGWRTGHSYMGSIVGRSAQLVSAAGAMRLMRILEELYKVSMAYAEPTVAWKGPKRGVLFVQRTFTPLAYHEGGALAIGSFLGMKGVEAHARPTGALSIELEVSWE
jgi:uncharacterized protein (TIGR02265 family)